VKRIFATIVKVALPIALACATSAAWGQASRTWVSGVGDDANPCSRTAPCKTFAGAISKTADCGEIDALDPAGYGAVTITKPITIDGGGMLASVLVAGTNGIVISVNSTTGPCTRVVTLRNLQVNGIGTGLAGIRFIAGDELHVENVNVFEFRAGAGLGLDFNPGTSAGLYVQNSTFTNNLNQGIWLHPTGSAVVTASIKTTKMSQNGGGILVSNNAYAVVSDSEAAGNGGYGFQVASSGPAAKLQLDRSVASDNGLAGVRADGASAVVRLGSSTIVANVAGLSSSGGGTIMSFGNNVVAGNLPNGDGAPTITSTLK
jgi:hypothetical protein